MMLNEPENHFIGGQNIHVTGKKSVQHSEDSGP